MLPGKGTPVFIKLTYGRSFNMIYSQEVENMCTVAQGVASWCCSDPGRSKMGKGKRS